MNDAMLGQTATDPGFPPYSNSYAPPGPTQPVYSATPQQPAEQMLPPQGNGQHVAPAQTQPQEPLHQLSLQPPMQAMQMQTTMQALAQPQPLQAQPPVQSQAPMHTQPPMQTQPQPPVQTQLAPLQTPVAAPPMQAAPVPTQSQPPMQFQPQPMQAQPAQQPAKSDDLDWLDSLLNEQPAAATQVSDLLPRVRGPSTCAIVARLLHRFASLNCCFLTLHSLFFSNHLHPNRPCNNRCMNNRRRINPKLRHSLLNRHKPLNKPRLRCNRIASDILNHCLRNNRRHNHYPCNNNRHRCRKCNLNNHPRCSHQCPNNHHPCNPH